MERIEPSIIDSIVPHATKQFPVGPDCSSKPNHMEASNPNCGGRDAIHHFSCIDCSIREIPNLSGHRAACSSIDKDSDPVCTDNKKEFDEVSVTEEDLNENGSRIKTATNSGKTSVSSIAEVRDEQHFSATKLNSTSAIQAELEIAKAGRELAEKQAAEEKGKNKLLASELQGMFQRGVDHYKAGW